MILSRYNQNTNPPHTQFLDCCKGSQPNITKCRERDDRKEKVFDPTINASLRMDWMDFWSKTINLKEIGAIVHFLWNLLTNKLSPTAAFSPSLAFYFFFIFFVFLFFCLLFFFFCLFVFSFSETCWQIIYRRPSLPPNTLSNWFSWCPVGNYHWKIVDQWKTI